MRKSIAAGIALLMLCGVAAAQARKTPVILDSDIGDDIDDTWALGLLLSSPELDLKLVVTDYANTEYRAKIVARLLEIARRTDVPVGIGIKSSDSVGPQAPWVKDYDLARYPGRVQRDGVQALIDTIMKSPEPVTLICLGPVPNIKAALQREPAIAGRARFVGMHGSVRKGYDGAAKPSAEYNVKCDPDAFRRALSAPWSVTITPLDTCGLVRLEGKEYASVRDSAKPLTRAIIDNYRIWCGDKQRNADTASSVLFDTVAVYLAISEKLATMEDVNLSVTDDGFTVIDPKGKKTHCALAWKDLPAFRTFLLQRLTGVGPR
jgi:inosine-uridine nucleoside N-ribohydrolase